MILFIDVGNTHIKIALLNNDETVLKGRFVTDRLKTADEYFIELYTLLKIKGIHLNEIEDAAISSVVPQVTGSLSSALENITGKKPLIIEPGIKTGLNIKIDDPASLGADMVCCCVAALKKFSYPMIIISMGTATAINVIDEQKAMIGGAIIPGVSLSLNALTKTSSLLTSINLNSSDKVIGTNTADCLKSGSIIGTAAMLDGMIDRIEKEIGKSCTVVATGGIAPIIIPSCNRKIILSDDLVIHGLKEIYSKNRKK